MFRICKKPRSDKQAHPDGNWCPSPGGSKSGGKGKGKTSKGKGKKNTKGKGGKGGKKGPKDVLHPIIEGRESLHYMFNQAAKAGFLWSARGGGPKDVVAHVADKVLSTHALKNRRK